MLRILIFGFLVVLAMNAGAQAQDARTNAPSPERIAASAAKEHIGSSLTVTGLVADVNIAERVVRLNFGQPFPNQVFTAVIFAGNTNKFSDLEKLKGRMVAVTGKVAAYRDRPQIVLTSSNQLSVIEAPVEKAATESKP